MKTLTDEDVAAIDELNMARQSFQNAERRVLEAEEDLRVLRGRLQAAADRLAAASLAARKA